MKLVSVCAVSSSSVALMAVGTQATMMKDNHIFKNIRNLLRGRDLQTEDLTMKRCWEECIASGGMSADECKALIESEIAGHEIPNLEIKVRTPRDEPTFNGSYWYIGIPTNYYGEASCDVNNAIVRYPWDWNVDTGSGVQAMTIPDTDCKGMTADECCAAIMANMETEGIPKVDVNGNCLACWVNAVPLEPIISEFEGGLGYIDHEYIEAMGPGVCQETYISSTDVAAGDDVSEAGLMDLVDAIETILADGSSDCSSLMGLQNELYIATRNVLKTRSVIGDLLCGICEAPTRALFVLPAELVMDLEYIVTSFSSATIDNDTNSIVIYTDLDMNVIEPPKIGGSRKGIDWNLEDDCDDAPSMNEDENPNVVTCTPNVPPSPAFCETAHFDPRTTRCKGPHYTRVSPADVPDYSVSFNAPTEVSPNPLFLSVKGQLRTRFFYTVCTSEDVPLDHIIFGWVGVCAVTNYQYRSYAFEGTEHGYFGGMDDDTCTAGFGFMESWEAVSDFGGCAELMMEIDGHVAVAPAVEVSLKFGDSFAKYNVKGADCTKCGNLPTHGY